MKLTGIAILKWNGEAEANSLGMAADVSSYGYFQRGAVKEMMAFVARTVAKRTQPGQRQSVQQDDFFCHAHNRDGLVGVVFVDSEYPVRSAFCVVNKVLDDFMAIHGTKWRAATTDSTEAAAMLEPALEKYQDPHQADKLAKIQSDLDETKVVLHRTIESMLERGEKLDTLVGKSEDLSMASQMFYKQARKTNSCCKLM
jgi:synaptobrevin family protein YKT6